MPTRIAPDQIVTHSGRTITPLNPDPLDIDIGDIAHALSNQCRFTGHTKKFYSVAQHSVLVSEIVPIEDALQALLHDASEAYLSDLARPIKHQTDLGQVYREAEYLLQRAIYKAFDLPLVEPESIKWADDVLLRTEMRDLMPEQIDSDGDFNGEFLDYEIEESDCWTPGFAKHMFLSRYKDLTRANR